MHPLPDRLFIMRQWDKYGNEKPSPQSGGGATRLKVLAITSQAITYSVVFSLLAWWLDRETTSVAFEAYIGPGSIFSNALPGILIAALIFGLSRRLGFSFLFAATIYWLAYSISDIKQKNLNQFLGLQDFLFLENLDSSTLRLFWEYLEYPWLSIIAVTIIIALFMFFWIKEKPSVSKFGLARAFFTIIPIALFALLLNSGLLWEKIYNETTVRPNRFSEANGILHRGLISNIVYTKIRNFGLSQEIDGNALKDFLSKLPERNAVQTSVADELPDIVIILSESLFDPMIMRDMEGSADPIPYIRSAIEAGYGGEMNVPTFGGGTIRTEFEILTGMPVTAFPAAPFPYMSLARKKIPGLPSHLKDLGYRTVAIHGNSGSFWNRSNTFKSMGFDKFITEAQFPKEKEKTGRWASDSTMTDLILKELTDGSSPNMIFAISMEAHSPYTEPKKNSVKKEVNSIDVPNGLGGKLSQELRNYLFHIQNADRQLHRMVKALKERKRPSVVLFFGDHLPGLGKTYTKLGFLNRQAAESQNVPWVMLRTDRKAPSKTDQPIRAWMLSGKLVEFAGLPEIPYFQFTNAAMSYFLNQSTPTQRMDHPGVAAAAVAQMEGKFNIFYTDSKFTAGGAQ